MQGQDEGAVEGVERRRNPTTERPVEMGVRIVQKDGDKQYWDDLSGKPLIPALVEKARLEELGEIAKHGVYEKVKVEEC